MGRPIEITRDEHSAAALRDLAARTRDGAVVRRLLGIALILEGHPREAAARLSGMDRQTLRDWAHRCPRQAIWPRVWHGLGCALSSCHSWSGQPPAPPW